MTVPDSMVIPFGPRLVEPNPVPRAAVTPVRGGAAAPELCQLLADYDPAHHPERALIEVKGNGLRHLWIGGDQRSREGQPFTAASHVRPALAALERAFGKPMFFDGEYIHDDGLDAANGDFRRGRGTGTVWLFDAVPLELWERNAPTAPLQDRKEMLLQRGRGIFGPGLGMLLGFPLDVAGTLAKFNELRALGFEGVTVKNAVSSYDRRRSRRWQKLTEHTRFLKLVGGETHA